MDEMLSSPGGDKLRYEKHYNAVMDMMLSSPCGDKLQ